MDEITKNIKMAVVRKDENKREIKIKIAERSYKFKITIDEKGTQEEEKLRKAAKLVNDKVEYCKRKYNCPETQDALSVAIIEFALRSIDEESMHDELRDLNVEVEKYLQIHEKNKTIFEK
ncbi:MAG: cell division protein ZapA [Prevotellaceae bacterium]|jgi:cell division protein ZapA|nr:cell division protein ZapA [Prevotellaceae bacterium]